ncbi:MAG: VWA domain-containing protein [Atopobiaceae bacterium]|nr:VWA domain-containing protein [Atopobiaceae bacterium]
MAKSGGARGKFVYVIALVLVFGLALGGLWFFRNFGKSNRVVNAEDAVRTITRLSNEIDPTVASPIKEAVDVEDMLDEADELPDISTCPITVDGGEQGTEIWASGEKSGNGTDGWMREMAEAYNREGRTVDGEAASVTLRKVSSGLSVDYIATGKAKPAGYSPSNDLWVRLLKARGVTTTTVAERTVGNLAGIALTNEKRDWLASEYATTDLSAVTDAVAAGNLVIGYTNPNTSAAGLNLLAAALDRYDPTNPLSEKAINGFISFQANIPFVAMTTQQMRDAAQRGSLDGFVTELQVYNLDPDLKRNYAFLPFGWRHDNPLVAVDGASEHDQAVLADFAAYCKENGGDLAKEYGFNDMDNYQSESAMPEGGTLMRELEAYKQAKDAGSSVIAVFVCDVSGSMDGEPIQTLQSSLINSMRYIGTNNYVGLVSFSGDVTINLPIARFDMNQQALFKGAVLKGLRASGNTATIDGIIVGTKLIEDALVEHPDAKPMLFVLSDGQQNAGHTLKDVESALTSLRIPVYTIAYGEDADIASLNAISSINEATTLSASTDDITYQLKSLFNANM